MKNKKFNIIILAAGQGLRLRPFTNKKPKCMVEIKGKSILKRQIEVLNTQKEIDEIVLIGGYMHEKLPKDNVEKIINEQFKKTNMLWSLFCASEKIQNNIIITYGDIIYSKEIIEKIIKDNSNISITIDMNWRKYWNKRFSNPLSDAETLKVDKNNNLLEIGKKPLSYNDIEGQYMGLVKLNSKGCKIFNNVFLELKNKANNINNKPLKECFLTDFLQFILEKGYKIKCIPVFSDWVEVDSVSDLHLNETIYRIENIENNL